MIKKTLNKWKIEGGILSGFVDDSDILRIRSKVTLTKDPVEGDHFLSRDKRSVLILGTPSQEATP